MGARAECTLNQGLENLVQYEDIGKMNELMGKDMLQYQFDDYSEQYKMESN